jgi:hypothetical protein
MVAFRRGAVLIISMGLAACQSTGGAAPEAAANSGIAPPPSNYRQMIVQQIKSSRAYARGIVEPEISNPAVGWGGLINGGHVITVCVRYKVPGGLLVSSTPMAYAFFFPNGKLEGGLVNAPAWYMLACGGERTFRPFPEIEHKV